MQQQKTAAAAGARGDDRGSSLLADMVPLQQQATANLYAQQPLPPAPASCDPSGGEDAERKFSQATSLLDVCGVSPPPSDGGGEKRPASPRTSSSPPTKRRPAGDDQTAAAVAERMELDGGADDDEEDEDVGESETSSSLTASASPQSTSGAGSSVSDELHAVVGGHFGRRHHRHHAAAGGGGGGKSASGGSSHSQRRRRHDERRRHHRGDANDEANAVEGPLITEALAQFELPTLPASLQSTADDVDTHVVGETASRLLFLSVHWIKRIRGLSAR